MIGYYVHHVGAGHLHRARAVAEASACVVTGLSSLPEPEGWPGPWLQLDRDDRAERAVDADAGGHLHWVPEHDDGLRCRMSALSAWIESTRPELLVTDVSVEVTLLARLHGVPVVSVVLPGHRGDRAHRAAYGVSSGLVAAWPRGATGMVHGLAPADARRLLHVGGLSRLPVAGPRPRHPEPPTVLLMSGRGGGHPTEERVQAARANAPTWNWHVLGGSGEWRDDPTAELDRADVVILQAGESAVADVAARRRPAVVVPASRPFGEQRATARVLVRGDWPCRVLARFPEAGWADLLDEVAGLEGSDWRTWCDGGAAGRFADYLGDFTSGRRRRIA